MYIGSGSMRCESSDVGEPRSASKRISGEIERRSCSLALEVSGSWPEELRSRFT
jgi:hypothetical protein